MLTLNHKIRVLGAASVCLILVACANTAPAPVVDLKYSKKAFDLSRLDTTANVQVSQNDRQARSRHIVKPGDTLFSIAWRYSLDHRELAKINDVQANTIYPGQTLNLLRTKQTVNSASQQKPFSSAGLLSAINQEVLNKSLNPTEQATLPVVSNQQASSSGTKRQHAVTTTNRKIPRNSSKLAISEDNNPVKQWIWPVNGKIVGRFSALSNMNKGLDIAAEKGSPVRATAEGRVVYSGSGLRGYGQLVIIKHNEQFLSAYAHNEKIHVEENEVVKAGQRIAELGNTGSDTDKLHFEIRLKGKPVDPLNYLPKSGLM